MEIWGGTAAVDTHVSMPGLDAWVLGRPYSGATNGGDVHYVSSCATGRVTRLLVADVSGHGSDVGMVADELRGLMRRYVNYIDQRRFFRAMNRKFAGLHTDGRFATAVVTTFFGPTDTLSVSNAGHPPPLLWRGRTREWTFLAPPSDGPEKEGMTNMPLGVIDATRYDRFDLKLEPGDVVLCYTDSLSEARDASGELMSMDCLLELANAIDGSRPAKVIPAFIAAVSGLWEGNLTGDDLTLLLFTPNGDDRRVPLRNRLLAPVRVTGSVIRSLRPGGGQAPWPELSLRNIGGAMVDRLNRVRR
jgi:serine phosphatase RsbU (regulator of sigma subunit)